MDFHKVFDELDQMRGLLATTGRQLERLTRAIEEMRRATRPGGAPAAPVPTAWGPVAADSEGGDCD